MRFRFTLLNGALLDLQIGQVDDDEEIPRYGAGSRCESIERLPDELAVEERFGFTQSDRSR